MPLYSYIPYLDPDIDDKQKKSFSGHTMDTDDELDQSHLESEPNSGEILGYQTPKTPADSYKRKVSHNLNNFNSKMADLLQDGLEGVNNICRQANIYDNTALCGTGDNYKSDSSKEVVYYMYPGPEASPIEFLRNKNVYAMQEHQLKDDISSTSKTSKPRSRTSSKGSVRKMTNPRPSSKSFHATPKTSDTKKSFDRIKLKKKAVPEQKAGPNGAGESCAKKRLGQIERDYQKVVENLGVVERMMACINERMMRQKAREVPTSQETVTTEGKSADDIKDKKVSIHPPKRQENIGRGLVSQNATESESTEDRRTIVRVKDERKTTKRKKTTKKRTTKDVPDKNQTDTKTPKKKDRSMKNESIPDIDALINNAVMELGYADFDISQGSSEASFVLANAHSYHEIYEEMNTVTSNSGSENVMLGEDCEKFEISKSFQELKESYVQQVKQKETVKKKAENKKPKSKARQRPKKCRDVEMNNSIDKLHEKILNDTIWNESGSAEYNLKDQARRQPEEFPEENVPTDKINKKDEAEPNDRATERKRKRITHQEDKDKGVNLMTPNVESISVPKKIRNQCKEEITEGTPNETVEKNHAFGQADSLGEHPEETSRQEKPVRKQQKKKPKDIATPKTATKDKVEEPKTDPEIHEEGDKSKHELIETTIIAPPKTKPKSRPKSRKSPKNPPQSIFELLETESKDFHEIKKMGSNFTTCSSCSSSSSLEEPFLWTKEDLKIPEFKPIDPMKQISIQCKKLIGDLMVEEDCLSLKKMMEGNFNTNLLKVLAGRPKRPRSVRVHTPIQDPDLRSIEPEVHRKKAISDLHERMEYQIKQTDSFDGFLKLMNKNRRKALIRQAEKQDHTLRCNMKSCFRRRLPHCKIITASVPPGYENKPKEKKDQEKKYINSLWFSPKDFKLRRNSRIFNRKRMEMYCQSLHKAQTIPRGKCEVKKKASNYSILVRSGTPLGRRPNTPRRWIQLRPPTAGSGNTKRPRLHHCDILDDLTLKDLAPFDAEYPRNDNKYVSESLQSSLLYKLACGGQKGDADGTLMELIAPKRSCTQFDCKTCKEKIEKKPKRFKKSCEESSLPSTKSNEMHNLTPKAAAQLLMHNIGEIKSKKTSTKSQSYEKNLNRQTKVKSLKKNPRKILTRDSKIAIQQRMEENLVKKIFLNQQSAPIEYVTKPPPSLKLGAFKGVDQFQRALKMPEMYSKSQSKRSNASKLFPYIHDPETKVFQNITVLPVKVFYDFEPLKDMKEKVDANECPSRVQSPTNITSLSETDEIEVSNVDYLRPSTAGDKSPKRRTPNRKRTGTPKVHTSRHDLNKFNNVPPNATKTMNTFRAPTRKQRNRRSNSVGKSTESDNTVSHSVGKKPTNPNPWKPASRRPRTPRTPPPPKTLIKMRSKERLDQQMTPQKIFSTEKISHGCCAKHRPKTVYDRGSTDSSRRESRDQTRMQMLVNKEKKLKFEMSPNKTFYNVDVTENRPQMARVPTRCRPLSPSQKVMVDHLQMLRHRNTKLQGNIQKAINIIEEKMVDVLSTNDHSYKKRTIDRMEREINKVLKMINEQNSMGIKKDYESDVQKTASNSRSVNVEDKKSRGKESTTEAKAFVTPSVGLKMPKPPRKRSISRVLKFNSRPSTVEEERSYDFNEDREMLRINERVAIEEEKDPKEIEQNETNTNAVEMYPSPIVNEEEDEQNAPMCPILRCPTPKESFTDLSKKTKTVMKQMSREAFGKFADVVKTKTKLIINMTKRFDMDDANLLPTPKIASNIPAILARSKLPVITTLHQSRTADLMSTTVSSIVSVQQTPFENILNASAEALSVATTEISEFANGCAERSITSFSGSESYTWGKIEEFSGRSQSRGLECSSCSLHGKISHDLTPFMRALNNLKAGRLFEKRHHLLPIEETSPNFKKLMGFLEGLTKVKETFNQSNMNDQLMWNPEKRCSFHNSIAAFRKFKLRKNTKAISEHSIVPSATTSFSDLLQVKIEGKHSETKISIEDIKEEPKEKLLKEKASEVQTEKREQKNVNLVFSQVHLVSIHQSKNLMNKNKKKSTDRIEHKVIVSKVQDDRYSCFLKFFYLIFYTLVYFCMSVMNFSCY